MAPTPLLLGLRWLSMELSLSEAMMTDMEKEEDRQRTVRLRKDFRRGKGESDERCGEKED
jgi:hypothetical protein